MKKLIWAMVSALILTSCDKVEYVVNGDCEVQFNISQWSASSEDLPTRTVSATDAQMTDIWLMAYSDGNLVKQVHQSSTDDGFGSITLKLDAGNYNFYVVSSRGASPVVDTDAKTITWGTVRDTFWATEEMQVSAGTNSKDITLSRVASRLRLELTDVIPDGTEKITFHPSHWYYALNYQTGAALSDSDADISVNIPASYIGRDDLSTAFMTISPTTDWTVDVTATLKGAGDATLGTVQVDGVPMARNKSTTMNGSILSGTRGLGLKINDTWLDPLEITF
jgi:hypothetical protein